MTEEELKELTMSMVLKMKTDILMEEPCPILRSRLKKTGKTSGITRINKL